MTRSIITSTALVAVVASLLSRDALGVPPEAQRYPFDPACAWGRLSDGKGLFVRCLSKEEAERLSMSNRPASPSAQSGRAASSGQMAPKPSTSVAVLPPPPASVTPTNSAAAATGDAASVALPANTPVAASPMGGYEAAKDALSAELVSVTADEGELPLAKRKLMAPHDRYAKCVVDHGGLSAAVGQVEVRFLVRERGRAEGTSVGKFHGMSEAAATCIAQVVDRRPTGAPAAPVVGATALIRVQRRPSK